MPTSITIPTAVQVRRDECVPTPANLACALNRWSPFEAACHLSGLTPRDIDPATGVATATWPGDASATDEQLPEGLDPSQDLAGELLELTRIIARNASEIGEHCLAPREIVAWAIKHKIAGARSELARHFGLGADDSEPGAHFAVPVQPMDGTDDGEHLKSKLDTATEKIQRLESELAETKRKTKETGKHHAQLRARLFAAALHRLARVVEEHHATLGVTPNSGPDAATLMGLISPQGQVVASRLAGLVDDNRSFYGFPEDDRSPARRTIEDQIAAALNNDQWKNGLFQHGQTDI